MRTLTIEVKGLRALDGRKGVDYISSPRNLKNAISIMCGYSPVQKQENQIFEHKSEFHDKLNQIDFEKLSITEVGRKVIENQRQSYSSPTSTGKIGFYEYWTMFNSRPNVDVKDMDDLDQYLLQKYGDLPFNVRFANFVEDLNKMFPDKNDLFNYIRANNLEFNTLNLLGNKSLFDPALSKRTAVYKGFVIDSEGKVMHSKGVGISSGGVLKCEVQSFEIELEVSEEMYEILETEWSTGPRYAAFGEGGLATIKEFEK